MNIEFQKLELIQLILGLRDYQALEAVKKFLKNSDPASQNTLLREKKKRHYGFAKGMTLHVAPDFDDTPSGFEEYMQKQTS